jgi:hypothetical protein
VQVHLEKQPVRLKTGSHSAADKTLITTHCLKQTLYASELHMPQAIAGTSVLYSSANCITHTFYFSFICRCTHAQSIQVYINLVMLKTHEVSRERERERRRFSNLLENNIRGKTCIIDKNSRMFCVQKIRILVYS